MGILPQDSGRVPLEPIDDLGHASCRVALDKEMDVIGHHFEGLNRHPQSRPPSRPGALGAIGDPPIRTAPDTSGTTRGGT